MIGKCNTGGGKSSGLYVWKRYEYTPERTVTNPTFKFATISSSVSTIKITSDSVDLTKVTSEFFAGFTFTDTTGTSCNFKLNTGISDGELIMFMGLSVYLNYDPESTSFVQAGSMGIGTVCSGRTATYSGNKTLPAVQGAFLDYVVSDSETAYPDGGKQDGYWYEKVKDGITLEMFGCTKYAVDKVTFSSDSYVSGSALSHSLGVIPKIATIVCSKIENGFNYATAGVGLATSDGKFRSIILTGNREYVYANNSTTTATSSKVTFQGTATTQTYKSGVEYILITMA